MNKKPTEFPKFVLELAKKSGTPISEIPEGCKYLDENPVYTDKDIEWAKSFIEKNEKGMNNDNP